MSWKSYINKRVGRHYTLVQNWLHVYEKINGRLHFAMSQSLHGQLYHDYCTNAFFFHRIFFLALNSIIIWSKWRQWSDDDVFLNSYFMPGMNAMRIGRKRFSDWQQLAEEEESRLRHEKNYLFLLSFSLLSQNDINWIWTFKKEVPSV